MPKVKVQTTRPIDTETLRTLQTKLDSPLIAARLRYMQAATFDKYLGPLEGKQRCYPSVLMTQASGRWSIQDPPLDNFAKDDVARRRNLPELRRVVLPDPGTYWLHWDWTAIEALLVAYLSGDTADIEAFEKGWDVHTLTACSIYRHPEPPLRTKAVHKAPCTCADGRHTPMCPEAWRLSWSPAWTGGEDSRRTLSKVSRYGLAYGPNIKDVILEAKGFEELGVTREMALSAADGYLTAKRNTLVKWKERTWAECVRTKESRTFLGRRRKLFGAKKQSVNPRDIAQWGSYEVAVNSELAKKGLNHQIQGAVSQVMDLTLKKIWELVPEAELVHQAHDGASIELPESVAVEGVLERIRPVVEADWEIGGRKMHWAAEWEVVQADGSKQGLH